MSWRERLFVFLNQRLARLLIPEQYRAAMRAQEEAADDEDCEEDQEHVTTPHEPFRIVVRPHWVVKSDGLGDYIGIPPASGID